MSNKQKIQDTFQKYAEAVEEWAESKMTYLETLKEVLEAGGMFEGERKERFAMIWMEIAKELLYVEQAAKIVEVCLDGEEETTELLN